MEAAAQVRAQPQQQSMVSIELQPFDKAEQTALFARKTLKIAPIAAQKQQQPAAAKENTSSAAVTATPSAALASAVSLDDKALDTNSFHIIEQISEEQQTASNADATDNNNSNDTKIVLHKLNASSCSGNSGGNNTITTSNNTATTTFIKSDDTQNVLLKQLLQNSLPTQTCNSKTTINSVVITSTATTGANSAQLSSSSSVCNPANLPGRKVINVRAPSLGLVSSLEAQLARPVIPPVPAGAARTNQLNASTTSSNVSTDGNQQQKITIPKSQTTTTTTTTTGSVMLEQQVSNNNSNSIINTGSGSSSSGITGVVSGGGGGGAVVSKIIASNENKIKTTVQISKETSFVSNPNVSSTLLPINSSVSTTSAVATTAAESYSGSITNTINTNSSNGNNNSNNTIISEVLITNSGNNNSKDSKQHMIGGSQLRTENIVLTTGSNDAKTSYTLISSTPINSSALSSSTIKHTTVTAPKAQAIKRSANAAGLQDFEKPTNSTGIACSTAAATIVYTSSDKLKLTTVPYEQSKCNIAATATAAADEICTKKIFIQQADNLPAAALPITATTVVTPTPTPTPMATAIATAAAVVTAAAAVTTTATVTATSSNTTFSNAIVHAVADINQQTDLNVKNKLAADAAKDADKKKRKRDYQKQRRQMLNNAKSLNANAAAAAAANAAGAAVAAAAGLAANSSNAPTPLASSPQAKKRCRKVSKVEEDYDSFIDNLMQRLRQMTPLEVMEPELDRNLHFRKMFNKAAGSGTVGPNSKAPKDNNMQSLQSQWVGEFGNLQPISNIAVYEVNNALPTKTEKENQLTAMQNNFYDQEFPGCLTKNEQERHNRLLAAIPERNVDATAIQNSIAKKPHNWSALSQLSFPGIVLLDSEYTQCLGRMSPVVPLIKPVSLKLKPSFIFGRDLCVSEPKPKELSDGTEKRSITPSSIKLEPENSNQTVVIAVSATAANNILGVLKNLANILRVPPPSKYTVVKNLCTDTFKKIGARKTQRLDKRKSFKSIALQQVLSGLSKVCRGCDQLINGTGISVCRRKVPSNKLTSELDKISRKRLHFCSKSCYIQFVESDDQSVGMEVNEATVKAATAEPPDLPIDKLKTKRPVIKSSENAEKPTLRHFTVNCFNASNGTEKANEIKLEAGETINADLELEQKAKSMLFRDMTCSAEDSRVCIFCNQHGDGVSDGPSRLLNFEVDKWVHLNCALWSNDVYETQSGGLMNFQSVLQTGLSQACSSCQQLGATVKCFKGRCNNVYHLHCAKKEMGVFYKDKTFNCSLHASKTEQQFELSSLSDQRRVYIERDENRQIAAVMHHSEMTNVLRVGSLTFLNVGQLLPQQLEAFHTVNHIYPVGYKIMRLYWSMQHPHKRCRYICTIADVAGRPEFRISVQEMVKAENASAATENQQEFSDTSPKAVWQKVLDRIAQLRHQYEMVQLFPQHITGEDLFGLTEPNIVRIIESLPGIETLTDYRFKYGRNPLLELPLAINPSGAARSEPKQRQCPGWRKVHTQRTNTPSNQRLVNSNTVVAGEVACPYSKQFVHSKSSQYKKMKQEWRNNVYLARSKIQGLGLYAARDIERHTMIIEYIGEVIRTEVSELREKQYEARNRGIYMFRLDEDRVVDATLSGGLARYINHSCNPNCVTEIVEVDREVRIIIFAKRRINRNEELSYDYKFDIEDDAHKIPCMCGAPNCRKWMN